MGQDLQRRAPGTPSRRPEPSWSTVAGTTVHLWLERHHLVRQPSAGRRRRLVVVLSALVAMALGGGITLAFTGANQQASAGGRPSGGAPGMTPLQLAAANRLAAAKWITSEVTAGVDVSCDYIMCQEAQQSGYPAGQLMVLPSTAPDPLGAELIVATPAIRSQFGTRLASVYAPQVIARFGSGPAGGTAPFNPQLPADPNSRIQAGQQLLNNKHVHASATARAELRAGQVDPLLLVTLAQLAHGMPVQLVAFDVSSPGVPFAIPWRGVEIGAVPPASLSAILAFWTAQQGNFVPAEKIITKLASGQSVVTVRYGAPSPMDLGGN